MSARIGAYTGAILAAGRGSRMKPFSERYPKPLLPVGNRPLLVRHIEMMRGIGIRRIIVLIGHKGYEIAQILGDGSQFGVEIRYVEQTEVLGIAHAVGRLESQIDKPFLLFLGDIYFHSSRLTGMFDLFEEQRGGAVLATKEETDPEAIRRNFSITLNPEGFVTRVIEKPRHTPNRLKGAGLYLFDPAIFDAIRRTPRTALRDEYELTDAIQVMIEHGEPVRPANVIDDDINLTNPGDLLRANIAHLSESANPLLGADTRIHPGAKLLNSVIGSRVVIDHPVTIENSVLFDDARLSTQEDVERVIVTPDGIVDCQYYVSRNQLQTGRVPAGGIQ